MYVYLNACKRKQHIITSEWIKIEIERQFAGETICGRKKSKNRKIIIKESKVVNIVLLGTRN
jgi:hypothetical protein